MKLVYKLMNGQRLFIPGLQKEKMLATAHHCMFREPSHTQTVTDVCYTMIL